VPQEVQVYTRLQIDQSGQSVQLHGLPVGTTLVLINGRRVEDSAITLGSAFVSNFFDLIDVPLSAVERIEVLPEGASAVYGSDAIAGVVNIILKREFSGAETSVRYSFANDLPQWDADVAAGEQRITELRQHVQKFASREGLGVPVA